MPTGAYGSSSPRRHAPHVARRARFRRARGRPREASPRPEPWHPRRRGGSRLRIRTTPASHDLPGAGAGPREFAGHGDEDPPRVRAGGGKPDWPERPGEVGPPVLPLGRSAGDVGDSTTPREVREVPLKVIAHARATSQVEPRADLLRPMSATARSPTEDAVEVEERPADLHRLEERAASRHDPEVGPSEARAPGPRFDRDRDDPYPELPLDARPGPGGADE